MLPSVVPKYISKVNVIFIQTFYSETIACNGGAGANFPNVVVKCGFRWWEELKTTTQHVLIRARRGSLTSLDRGTLATLSRLVWTQKVRQLAKCRRSSDPSLVSSHLRICQVKPFKPWKYQVKPWRAPTWLLWLTWTRCCARRCTRSRGQGAPAWISPENI